MAPQLPSEGGISSAQHLDSAPICTSLEVSTTPFWRKPIRYALLGLVFTFLLYYFYLWITGSYRILSDNPLVWQSSIDKLNAEDKVFPISDNEILFVGSSSIRLFENLDLMFPEHSVRRKGFGGAKINDLAYYQQDLILKYQPKSTVFYIGINDILYRDYQHISELYNDLFLLTDNVRQSLPNTQLILLAIRPVNKDKYLKDIHAFNSAMKTYSSNYSNVYFINANAALLTNNQQVNDDLLMWDGLHLNEAGYQVWGELIRKQINHIRITQSPQ